MRIDEIYKDTFIVGKMQQDKSMAVTEAILRCNGDITIRGYKYRLKPQVKKVLVNQVAEDEN